jgi:hypothetical protein
MCFQSAGVTLEFARQMTRAAFSPASPMSGVCGELIDSIVNECVDTFEMAAQGKYDRFVHCIKQQVINV